MLSVLMSVYVRERPSFLDECLRSISAQTRLPSEIVLVKDGPLNDELEKVISDWEELLPLIVIPLKENSGLAHALNIGLQQCRYDLIARMDSDDLCAPKRLETQTEYMVLNPDVDVCGSFSVDIDGENQVIGDRTVPRKHEDITRLIWSCPFVHPSVMYRKSKILSIGSYRIDAGNRQEDYDLWIRAAKANLCFHNLAQPLLYYRCLDDSYKKNSFEVGFRRLMLGFPAAWQHDRRVISFIALFYPMFRSLMPKFLSKPVLNLAKRFDPR